MTDLLTDALPTVWEGRPIDPDYRHMVRLISALRRAKTDEAKAEALQGALDRFYPAGVPEADLPEVCASMMRFAQGGTAEEGAPQGGDGGQAGLVMDYHCDAAYILGAFQQAYGIDLTTAEVHWWRFQALLRALPKDTTLSWVLHVRSADTSEMPQATRQQYEQAKEIYALPPELEGGSHDVTPQQHDAAFLARFRAD